MHEDREPLQIADLMTREDLEEDLRIIREAKRATRFVFDRIRNEQIEVPDHRVRLIAARLSLALAQGWPNRRSSRAASRSRHDPGAPWPAPFSRQTSAVYWPQPACYPAPGPSDEAPPSPTEDRVDRLIARFREIPKTVRYIADIERAGGRVQLRKTADSVEGRVLVEDPAKMAQVAAVTGRITPSLRIHLEPKESAETGPQTESVLDPSHIEPGGQNNTQPSATNSSPFLRFPDSPSPSSTPPPAADDPAASGYGPWRNVCEQPAPPLAPDEDSHTRQHQPAAPASGQPPKTTGTPLPISPVSPIPPIPRSPESGFRAAPEPAASLCPGPSARAAPAPG